MPVTGMDAPVLSRRTALAGLVSLAVHGGLLVLGVLLVSLGHSSEPHDVSLTEIEVVAALPPTPPPVPGVGTGSRGAMSTNAGTRGRRGHDVPQRSMTRAPAIQNPYADLAMTYDAPTGPHPGPHPGGESDSTGSAIGTGLFGDGRGNGLGTGNGDGVGNAGGLAPPPVPSLARPASPKYAYRNWGYRAPTEFAGSHVLIELTIGPKGSVKATRLISGVSEEINTEAIETARRYEFYPALDAAGQPITSKYQWDFVLQAIAR